MQEPDPKTPHHSAFSAAEVAAIRKDFPYYERADSLRAQGRDHPIYLDHAATSQRPARVLRAEYDFAALNLAAVHRGTSSATGNATSAYESARNKIANFLGAGSDYSLIFTSGATDSLNTLAFAISDSTAANANAGSNPLGVPGSARFSLFPGDEVLVPESEHHANLIPWQRLSARTGARLVTVPVNQDGLWAAGEMLKMVNSHTKIVAFAHASNVTGQTIDAAQLSAEIKKRAHPDAITVLDACQSVSHGSFKISDLGVDFAAFSGHKMYGPNGIGGLLGRTELLQALPPARTGGSAVTKVFADTAEFLPPPQRFEPGTGPLPQAIGLAAAVDYLEFLGMQRIAANDHELTKSLLAELNLLPGVKVIGDSDPNAARCGLVSIVVPGVHPHDVGQILDTMGVTVRVGHHCAQPLHRALGVSGSVRASVSMATTFSELDAFITGVKEAQKYFGVV